MTEQLTEKPNSYSQLEWEAFLDVPALQGIEYKLPYSLECVGRHTMQDGYKWQLYRIGWEFPEERATISEWSDIPKAGVYRILFNDVPMSNFCCSKMDACKIMEMYNIRHFKVIKMSNNPLSPVLI